MLRRNTFVTALTLGLLLGMGSTALADNPPGIWPPPLEDGMVRVRNRWLSVDPYMRGRMNDTKSYVPPFQLGEPMDGGAVGEVVESKADGCAAEAGRTGRRMRRTNTTPPITIA